MVLVALAASLFAPHQRPAAANHATKVFLLPQAHAGPSAPIVGPDGNIWFIELGDGTSAQIARITPDGHLTQFALPTDSPNVLGLVTSITSGPDGNLWFTMQGGASSSNTPGGAIGRITPNGAITEFPLPTEVKTAFTPGASLESITTGPDGNLWFTAKIATDSPRPGADASSGAIGRITPQGSITLFPVPAPWTQPGAIIAGKDGSLWFIAINSNGSQSALGSVTTRGAVTMYGSPARGLQLDALAAAPDGSLWVGEIALGYAGGAIGHVDSTGRITEYRLPTTDNFPVGITFAPDGALWVALVDNQITAHDALARVSPSGVITEFPLPARTTPTGIVWGPDGNLWVTELTANAIARINPPK